MLSSFFNMSVLQVAIFLFIITTNLQARFTPKDADKVDDEDERSLTFYNDVFAYGFSHKWTSLFDQSQAALLASSGSLDEFSTIYFEEIKLLSSNDLDVIEMEFEQIRIESLPDHILKRELRLRHNTPIGISFSALVDGDSYKKWLDIGAGIGVKLDKYRYFEFSFWNVDTYYNEKDSLNEDKYKQKTQTVESKLDWKISGARLLANVEYDSPLEWSRKSQNYDYFYKRLNAYFKYMIPISKELSLWLFGSQETKKERKKWTKTVFDKAMDRKTNSYELGLVHEKDGVVSEGYIKYINRNVKYTHIDETQLPEYSLPETKSKDHILKEFMLAYTYNHELYYFENHRAQWGIFLNRVNSKRLVQVKRTELKIQTAIETRFSEYASIFWNLTWDIDRGIESKKSFGGGNVQFFMHF